MAISRMQEPRQLYGLGSIVKKAVRGVKKVVKSPIGKAAVIGGLGMIPFGASNASLFSRGLGALKGIGAARNMPAMLTRGMGGTPARSGFGGFLSSLNPFGGNFSGKNAFLTAGALATAAPFIADAMAPEEVEEEVEEQIDVGGIRQSARDFYRGLGGKNLAFMPQKQYVQKNFYDYANGGRAMLNMGGQPGEQQAEQMLMAEYVKYKNKGGTLSFQEFVQAVMQASQQPEGAGIEQPMAMAANGGRIGYKFGGLGSLTSKASGAIKNFKNALVTKLGRMTDDVEITTLSDYGSDTGASMDLSFIAKSKKGKSTLDDLVNEGILDVSEGVYTPKAMMADDAIIGMEKLKASGVIEEGGEFRRFDQGAGEGEYGMPYYGYDQLIETFGKTKGKADGGRIGKQEGGIMEASEMIDMGGMEKDFRNEGGFVAMGGKERADDVPARLSKNEFVFTADAVRNAGGGDIDKGAEVMENLMNNLEQGGEVSEDSQGLEGAQAMYDQQQMLQSRVI